MMAASGTPRRDAPAGARASVGAANLPLRLIGAETSPLYLQIASQIRHLIITQQLVDGTRLPAVRQLAKHLDVNVGTVVQAYRELAGDELVESVRGRGTIVRSLSSTSADDAERARRLADAAARLVTRARSLGFEATDAWAQVDRVLAGATAPDVPVVFVAMTVAQAQRYADELNERFANRGVRFVAYGVEDVFKADPGLLGEFDLAYTVVTFVTLAPEVERALAAAGATVEIIGITVELSRTSIEQLTAMSPARDYTLVTERRAVATALAQVTAHSPVPADAIEVVTDALDGPIDPGALDVLASGSRIVIFSFGVYDEIATRAISPERLIELRFEIGSDALARLERRWEAP